jgi:hypothetical protein
VHRRRKDDDSSDTSSDTTSDDSEIVRVGRYRLAPTALLDMDAFSPYDVLTWNVWDATARQNLLSRAINESIMLVDPSRRTQHYNNTLDNARRIFAACLSTNFEPNALRALQAHINELVLVAMKIHQPRFQDRRARKFLQAKLAPATDLAALLESKFLPEWATNESTKNDANNSGMNRGKRRGRGRGRGGRSSSNNNRRYSSNNNYNANAASGVTNSSSNQAALVTGQPPSLNWQGGAPAQTSRRH